MEYFKNKEMHFLYLEVIGSDFQLYMQYIRSLQTIKATTKSYRTLCEYVASVEFFMLWLPIMSLKQELT